LVEGIGGLGGVLATVGTLFTRVFSDKISQTLTNTIYNI
jgi:hypothetical protein